VMDVREMNFLGISLAFSLMGNFVRFFYPLLSPVMFIFSATIFLVCLHKFGWIFYFKLIFLDYLVSIYSIYQASFQMAGQILSYQAISKGFECWQPDIFLSYINQLPDSPLTWFIIFNILIFSIQLILIPYLRIYLSHGQFLNRIMEATK
jgi:hypothetical protein